MRKLTKKISMLMVLAMLVGLFSGVVSASAASKWSFKSSKYDVAVDGEINMKKNEYADFDLLNLGKAPEGYTVAWESSDEDVVWVNAKTGQLRADKAKKAEDGDKAVISATFTNTKTKKSATRSFTIVVGEVKAPVYTVEQADVTAVLGDAIKFAPVVKNEAGEAVKFATHKSYNGYFLDGKAITNPWTPEAAGEYTVVVAQFASKADVADLAKAVRKDEVKVTVKADLAAEATGVKEITVYGDFAKDAKFTVKKGTSTIALAGQKIAEDGKSAILTLVNKLTKGTYTVVFGDAKVDVVAEDEKVASIVILDDGQSVTVDGSRKYAFVHYDAFNQYGESVRKNYSIDWTTSTGVKPTDDKATGTLKIKAGNDADDTFVYGATIIITGVYTSSGNVATVNATVTAGLENRVDRVEVLGVVKDGTTDIVSLPKGFKSYDYMLVYKAFDQAGYELDYTWQEVGDNISITSLSPLLIGSDFVAVNNGIIIDGVKYGAVRLTRGIQTNKGGVAELQITSKQTGTTKIHKIELAEEQVLSTFNLLAPDFIIAEKDGYVEIPFEAYDQNGVAVTAFRTLHKSVTLNDARLMIEKKNDGSAKVVFNASGDFGATKNSDAPVMFTSTVMNSGYVSTLSLNIKDQAIPSSVKGLGAWHKNNLVEGGNVSIDRSSGDNGWGNCLKYYDQYDREMSNAAAHAAFTAAGSTLKLGYKTQGNALAVAATGNLGGYVEIANNLYVQANTDITEGTVKQAIEFVVIDTSVDVLATPTIEVEASPECIVEFAVHDITQFRSFKFNIYNGTDTLLQNGAKSEYKNVVGVLANGAEADVPQSYVVLSASDPTYSSSIAVTAATFEVSPNFTEDKFKDYSKIQANNQPAHVKQNFDVVGTIIVPARGGAQQYVKDVTKQNVIVDNDIVRWTDIVPNFTGDTFTVQANEGKIYYRDIINAAIKEIKSNYGDLNPDWKGGKTANLQVTISKVVESEDGLYSGDYLETIKAITPVKATYVSNVSRNNGNPNGDGYLANQDGELMLQDAETGDTFEVNFKFDSNIHWGNVTFKCVVGADKTAKFNSASTNIIWR